MSRKPGSKGSQRSKEVKAAPKRPVDVHFERFDRQYQHPGNRVIQCLALPVFCFAVLGLVWMVPFPAIGFLANHGYDTFLNWGSFFIAGIVYFYLRLAPTLSYAMLLVVGLFSFLIVQLEYVERDGGPAVWLVCAVLLVLSIGTLYLGKRLERGQVSLRDFLLFLAVGPIWLWHFVFKKLNVPY